MDDQIDVPALPLMLSLPVPESGNRANRVGQGHLYANPVVKAYRRIVADCLRQQVPGHVPFEGSVALVVVWYRARKAGDLDNRLKVLLDCLAPLVYRNDRQVCSIHAVRSDDDPAGARIDVVVEEVE